MYQGTKAIKIYQDLRESIIKKLRDSESSIVNIVQYAGEVVVEENPV